MQAINNNQRGNHNGLVGREFVVTSVPKGGGVSLLHNVEENNLVKQKNTIEEYTFSLLMGIKVMQEPKYAVKMKKKVFLSLTRSAPALEHFCTFRIVMGWERRHLT